MSGQRSFCSPHRSHGDIDVWDVLAIGEYLAEWAPKSGLLPVDPAGRARCRSICHEMHSGFTSLRSLPVNLKAKLPGFKVWGRAHADIDRITQIWRECLGTWGGPFLFGPRSIADAMYAPVVTRLRTDCVPVEPVYESYCAHIMAMPEMIEWIEAACAEPDEIEELDVEFQAPMPEFAPASCRRPNADRPCRPPC
jgi:glutathione S-transferase